MDDNIVTVSKFLKKVDVDNEEYGENIIGDISYNKSVNIFQSKNVEEIIQGGNYGKD